MVNISSQLVEIQFEDFGGVPTLDGNDTKYAAKNTAALMAAIAKMKARTQPTNATNRATTRQTLNIGPGVFVFETTTAALVDFVGFELQGAGINATTLIFKGTGTFLSFGVFSATPADLFGGTGQGYKISDLAIINPDQFGLLYQGSRVGTAIQDNGSGSGVINNVLLGGYGYGYNCPYGSDFDTLTNLNPQLCDVGVYFGPGCQQITTVNYYAYLCNEGMVLDRCGESLHLQPWFVGAGVAAITLESKAVATETRQLTAFPPSGTSYDTQLVFNTPWFEANPGPLGDATIPPQFINVDNENVTTAYVGMTINNPWIGAGETVTPKFVAAFAANNGAANTGLQRLTINTPSFSGKMTYWLKGGFSRFNMNNIRVVDGYTAPIYIENPVGAANQQVEDVITNTNYYGSAKFAQQVLNFSANDGWRTNYALDATGNSVLQFGQYIGGAWFDRIAFDIGNRRIYIGGSTDICLSRQAAMPTAGAWNTGSFVYNTVPVVAAGKVLLGWSRLTTGSGHEPGTDWSPVYGTTT